MANRKLQGEIERVLKKVDEGVQIFEQIWDKVYSAATTAQKEKYEGELKKEIKKLQRLRDQIKTWQGDSSIKDKTKLDANRKLIEEKMEKFKVCEKETKTKAFSKEGLAQDRTDPKQKAKAEVGDWVREAIERLKEQCEEMEAEIESLNSGKRKRRNDENPKVAQLKENISRHQHHQEMLERVLRAVDNDAVTPEEATELKDSVDYYIESNQDPDFVEDDEMYDMLNLEAAPVPVTTTRKTAKPNEKDEEEETPVTPTSSSSQVKKVMGSPRSARGSRNASSTTSISNTKISTSRVPSPKNGGPSDGHGAVVNAGSGVVNHGAQNASATHTPARSPRKTVLSTVGKEPGLNIQGNAPLLSSVVRGATNGKVNSRSVMTQIPQNDGNVTRRVTAAVVGAVPPKPITASDATPGASSSSVTPSNGGLPLRDGGMFPPMPGAIAVPSSSGGIKSAAVTGAMGGSTSATDVNGLASSEALEATSNAIPVDSLTISPATASATTIGPTPHGINIPRDSSWESQVGPEELRAGLAAVEASLSYMPVLPSDVVPNAPSVDESQSGINSVPITSMGVHASSPRNPVNVPPSFPSVAAPVFDSRDVFKRFDTDTLFFIFYYQQGTYQQYLAASELKRQGWRFHKKYLTWFQRHDEPKVSTDEFETGTFIYFDYANVVVRGQGSGWCQRIKSEFVFEYRYLEDELR